MHTETVLPKRTKRKTLLKSLGKLQHEGFVLPKNKKQTRKIKKKKKAEKQLGKKEKKKQKYFKS